MPSHINKRILSFLLAVIVVVSAIPFSVLAAENVSVYQEIETCMAEYVVKYGLAADMTDEQLLNVYWAMDDATVQAAWDELTAIGEKGVALSEAELQMISTNSDYRTICRFIGLVNQLNTPQLLADQNYCDDNITVSGGSAASDGSYYGEAEGSNILFWTNPGEVTLYVKNNASQKAIITFNLTITGAVEFKIDDAAATHSGGLKTITLDGGAQMKFYAKSKDGTGNTVKILMSDFSYAPVSDGAEITINFDTALGSVTQSTSTAVTAGKPVSITTETVFTAKPNSGAEFVAWTNESNELIDTVLPLSILPTSNQTINAIFSNGTPYFLVNNKYVVKGLSEAITKAGSTANSIITLMNNATLPAGEYTIPGNVTLLIPFDVSNTLCTSEPEADVYISGSTLGIDQYASYDWITPTPYRTLTMASGAKLTVNGAISLSAKHHAAVGGWPMAGSPTGPCSYLNMKSNSSITVANGGKLYAWGYIYGDGAITAQNGATVYENFQFQDFRGGTQTTNMKNAVFPLSQYYVQNIEVPLTLETGATEYGYTSVIMSSQHTPMSIPFIGPSSANPMFLLSAGSVCKKYDGSTDRLIITASSDSAVNLSPISLTLSGTSINSGDYDLGLNGNITVHLSSGSNATISQDLALLPGARVIVEQGATMTLAENCNVYVYDADQWGSYCFYCGADNKFAPIGYAPGKKYTRTEADLVDASIQVDGTLDASKGFLYTTESGANIHSTGTGVVMINAGTQTITHQLMQAYTDPDSGAASAKYVEIPLTTAKLKNQNGDYVTTTTATYTHKHYDASDANKPGKWGTTHEESTEEVAPTCTEKGYTKHTCNDCGYTYNTNEAAATGHSYNSVVTDPTCTAEGYTTYTCTVCSDSYKGNTVAANGHSYNSVVTDPTCTERGYTTHTCSVCGDSYTDSQTAAAGHNYQVIYTWAADYSACTASGSCGTCGDSVSATVNATSKVTTEADCVNDLVTTYTADFTETWANDQAKPVTGNKDMTKHTGSANVYTDNGNGTHKVSYSCCGTVVEEAEVHNYENGTCACKAVQTFTVTWVEEDGETVVDTETVNYNQNATKTPVVPSKTGYTGSWTGTTSNIKQDTTIKATYTPNKYKVTWMSNGVTYNGPENQAYDAKLAPPTTNPSKTGYEFAGWWTEDGTTQVTENTIFREIQDTTYYAHWNAMQYEITWNADGNTSTTQQTYDANLVLPTAPTKDGYTFLGWFTQGSGGNPVTADTVYQTAGTTTYYAQWEAIEYTVTWYADGDGEVYKTDTPVYYGDAITKPETDPTKEKVDCTVYTFAGWSDTVDGNLLETLPNVTGDASYYAVFTEEMNHGDTSSAQWEVATRATYSTAPINVRKCPTCGEVIETDETPVSAMIGSNSYTTLKDALNAANMYDTITLKTDITYATNDPSISNSLVFNLNGHTIDAVPGAGYTTYSIESQNITVVKKTPFEIAATNISAGVALDLYFWVWEYDLEGEDYKAVVTKEFADGRENVVEEIPYSQWEQKTDAGIPYRRFVFTDISAKEMMDDIHVEIYNTSNNEVVSAPCTETIEKYAVRTLNGEYAKSNRKLTTALVDMLNYGAAAQEYFGYNNETDKMANINISNFQSYATTDISTYENGRVPGANLTSTTLSAKNQIMLTFYFKNINRNMTAYVTYTPPGQEAKTWTIPGEKFYYRENKGWYGVDFSEIPIADGAQLVTCVVKDGETEVGRGMDSVAGYCVRNRTSDNGSGIFEKMLKFVDSAYNYFRVQ